MLRAFAWSATPDRMASALPSRSYFSIGAGYRSAVANVAYIPACGIQKARSIAGAREAGQASREAQGTELEDVRGQRLRLRHRREVVDDPRGVALLPPVEEAVLPAV